MSIIAAGLLERIGHAPGGTLLYSLLQEVSGFCDSALASGAEPRPGKPMRPLDLQRMDTYEPDLQRSIINMRLSFHLDRGRCDSETSVMLQLWLASLLLIGNLVIKDVSAYGSLPVTISWMALLRRKCTRMIFNLGSHLVSQDLDKQILEWRESASVLAAILRSAITSNFESPTRSNPSRDVHPAMSTNSIQQPLISVPPNSPETTRSSVREHATAPPLTNELKLRDDDAGLSLGSTLSRALHNVSNCGFDSKKEGHDDNDVEGRKILESQTHNNSGQRTESNHPTRTRHVEDTRPGKDVIKIPGLTGSVNQYGILWRLGLEILRGLVSPGKKSLSHAILEHLGSDELLESVGEWRELLRCIDDVQLFSIPFALLCNSLPDKPLPMLDGADVEESELGACWSQHWRLPDKGQRPSARGTTSKPRNGTRPRLRWNGALPFDQNGIQVQCALQMRWLSIARELMQWYPSNRPKTYHSTLLRGLLTSYAVAHLFNRQTIFRIHLQCCGFVRDLTKVPSLFHQERESMRLFAEYLADIFMHASEHSWNRCAPAVLEHYLAMLSHCLERINHLEKIQGPFDHSHYLDRCLLFLAPSQKSASSVLKMRDRLLSSLNKFVTETQEDQLRKELQSKRAITSSRLIACVVPAAMRTMTLQSSYSTDIRPLLASLYSLLVQAANTNDALFRERSCNELMRFGLQLFLQPGRISSMEESVTAPELSKTQHSQKTSKPPLKSLPSTPIMIVAPSPVAMQLDLQSSSSDSEDSREPEVYSRMTLW